MGSKLGRNLAIQEIDWLRSMMYGWIQFYQDRVFIRRLSEKSIYQNVRSYKTPESVVAFRFSPVIKFENQDLFNGIFNDVKTVRN